MAEELATADRDVRAARRLTALRRAKHLSIPTLAQVAGIGTTTLYDIERHGLIPHDSTQGSLCRALGVSAADIWQRPRRNRPTQRPASQRAVEAVRLAMACPTTQAHLDRAGSHFAYGIAWAVVRAGNPYASTDLIAERAALAARESCG